MEKWTKAVMSQSSSFCWFAEGSTGPRPSPAPAAGGFKLVQLGSAPSAPAASMAARPNRRRLAGGIMLECGGSSCVAARAVHEG